MTATDVVGAVVGCCSQVMSTLVHVLSCVSTLRSWGIPKSKYMIIYDGTMKVVRHVHKNNAVSCTIERTIRVN